MSQACTSVAKSLPSAVSPQGFEASFLRLAVDGPYFANTSLVTLGVGCFRENHMNNIIYIVGLVVVVVAVLGFFGFR